MLLVDNDQAESREVHVFLQQPVRADQDVDAAFGQALDRIRLLARGAKARQFGDLGGPGLLDQGKAVGKVLVMLLGKQGGRTEHRHLLAAGHGDESGAQRHFGLAEADVAAHQPVHRLAGAHVGHHRVDRGKLVGCFLEAEAVGEGFHVVLFEVERVPLARGALRVEREQFGSGVAHLLGSALLRLFPLA